MATIDDLPFELLGDILELLDETKDLYRAALVCRSWGDPAQRALFGDVMLRPYGETRESLEDNIPAWLSSSARARYRIHTLTLGHEFQDSFLESISSACPALRSLNFGDCFDGGYALCHRVGDRLLDQLEIRCPANFPDDPLPLKIRAHAIAIWVNCYDLDSKTLVSIFQASRMTLRHLQIFGLYSGTIADNLIHTLKVEPFQSVCRLDISTSKAFESCCGPTAKRVKA